MLVAINYRLGPLGFYSLGDEKVLVLDSICRLSENVPGSRQCRAQRPGSGPELGVRKHCQLWGRPRQGEYTDKVIRLVEMVFQKVTIFGESAGSSSVNYQLLSPLSQGTFQRAIMQSGTVLGVSFLITSESLLVQVSWGSANTPEQAVSYGRELIQNLGCEVDTEVCLQNATVEVILQNTFLH